jgi:hypothetical protein
MLKHTSYIWGIKSKYPKQITPSIAKMIARKNFTHMDKHPVRKRKKRKSYDNHPS